VCTPAVNVHTGYPHGIKKGVLMEILVALLPFGLLALVGLVTWAYRKSGWPTASPRLNERASQPMDPSYTSRGLPGAHFIGE
jgi:hypothetical protein